MFMLWWPSINWADAWTPLACPPPRKATRIFSPGRRASEPLGALGRREPAVMGPDSLVTLELWGSRRWRKRKQNAATGVATASLTRERPNLPPGRYWPARQPESPKAEMVA